MAKLPKNPVHPSRPPQRNKRKSFAPALSWNRINVLISFILIVLLASPGGYDQPADYELNNPLPSSFIAPFDLVAVDSAALKQRLDDLDKSQYVKIDPEIRDRGFERLDALIELARQAHKDAEGKKTFTENASFAALVNALEDLGLKAESARKDAELFAQRGLSDKLANEIKTILTELYDERGTAAGIVLSSLIAHAADGTLKWTSPDEVPRKEYDPERILETPGGIAPYLRRVLPSRHSGDTVSRGLVERVILGVAEPVIVRDSEAKKNLQKEAESNPPTKSYTQGQVVFAAGTMIGEAESQVIHQFAERQRLYRAVTTLGIAAFVALLFILIGLYLRKFPGEMPNAPSSIILIGLPTILTFAFWRLLQLFGIPDLAGYGFPAALIGMLGVVLLGPRFAWLLVTCAGLLFGVASGFNFSYALVALFGGFTAVSTLYTTRSRWDILTSAGIVSFVNAIVILSINFILDPAELSQGTARAVAYGVTNGLLCGALVFPLLWLFERLFGVVTDFALLELTGTIHPLIRELEEKAPGSYQHTLNVTKLAEAAAREIGANYLLVRAGGYFHDIGKFEKPRYFSENQLTQEDRLLHSKLSPYMSTLIIKNHVKEGIELASKARGRHKIPREVIAFIPEHQGTSLITYFYRQAQKQFQESESTDPVHEDDFRYPGPKPQSIETAIVMLADSVEATVTAVFTTSTVNEDELRRVVRKSINDKFDDGQFDECDLTLRDLHLISESFVKTLLGRFHQRVQYPDGQKVQGTMPSGVRRVGVPLVPQKTEHVAGR